MKNRIAFISEHASPLAALGGKDSGGQNVYVGELARELVSLGYCVDIFTRRDDPRLPEVVGWMPAIRVIHVDAGPPAPIPKEEMLPFMGAFTACMEHFILRHKISYTLIHANFFMSGMVACALKARFRIPFAITFHALGYVRRIHQRDMDRFPTERLTIEEDIVRQADRIIAECPQDREDLISYYAAPPDKIAVIPCGFNPLEFHPVDRQLARMMLNLPADAFLLLQLGRMVPRKGVDNVIRSLRILAGSGIQARLLVVGGDKDCPRLEEDPEMRRLYDIAVEDGVEDKVIFAGRKNRDQLKYYYAAADVFVTTPWYEPFGITPLEAMACGRPVVGARVGGIQYSVQEGKTGFLVPPRDPEALADRIARLAGDARLAARMQKQALKRVHQQFTWNKVALMMHRVYGEMLCPYRSPRQQRAEKISLIESAFEKTVETLTYSKQVLAIPLFNAATLIGQCLGSRHSLFVLGQGKSASPCELFARELGQKLQGVEEPGGVQGPRVNHVGDHFTEQLVRHGRRGDLLLCLGSGSRPRDLLGAIKLAHHRKMNCIAILGQDFPLDAKYTVVHVNLPLFEDRQIQEIHLHILNTLCELIDIHLFPRTPQRKPGPDGKGQKTRPVMSVQ